MTTGKTIALTRQTFVGKVISLLWDLQRDERLGERLTDPHPFFFFFLRWTYFLEQFQIHSEIERKGPRVPTYLPTWHTYGLPPYQHPQQTHYKHPSYTISLRARSWWCAFSGRGLAYDMYPSVIISPRVVFSLPSASSELGLFLPLFLPRPPATTDPFTVSVVLPFLWPLSNHSWCGLHIGLLFEISFEDEVMLLKKQRKRF